MKKRAGLRRHEELAKCPMDRLALLAHMLPRRQEVRDAALFAVYTAASAPWTLTENFIACTKADTQKMFLSISGAYTHACMHACMHNSEFGVFYIIFHACGACIRGECLHACVQVWGTLAARVWRCHT